MTSKSQKIVKFSAQNMMRLEAVEIQPDGDLVIVGGRNAQGKTSVLNCIAMAMGGGAEIPDEPIRRGEKKAEVILELEDLTVVRKFRTGKASKLEVTAKDRGKLTSPQKVLDALMGGLKRMRLTFDPLEFCRADGRKQLDILKQIVAVDLGSLEEQRQVVYDRRTETNRELKRLQGALEEAQYTKDAPAEEVSVAELVKEREAARHINANNKVHREDHVGNERGLAAAQKQLDKARAQVVEFEEDVAGQEKFLMESGELVKTLEDIDLTPLDERIASAEDDNRKARENAKYDSLMDAVDAKDKEWTDLACQIDSIDEEKRATLAAAPFPVPGLGFDEDGISFNDLPFGQASQAEQLRVAVAIGLAMNTELRVLLIRDGSLLDDDSLAQLAGLAKESDAQLWVERVGEGEECSVIIEDGQVKS